MKTSSFAAFASLALLASTAGAQNLLANPSFENGGLNGWMSFGSNVSAETANPPAIVPRTGNAVCKIFGDFTGGFNVVGIFQSFSASPGQSWSMDCWTRHWSGDPILGNGPPVSGNPATDNWVLMKLAFFDGSNTEIGNAEGLALDGTMPQDQWIDCQPITGIAPVGTVRVEAFILYLQPGNGGGAALIDDIEVTGPPSAPAYPGTGEDLILSSAVGGTFLSTGPGTDIKQAPAGSLIELNVSSPNGTFDLYGYYLLVQFFQTGMPPTPQPAFPELWFGFNTFVILVNGAPTPIGPPVISPSGGSSVFHQAPQGFGGLSALVQGLVINPIAANGLYAATDGHEIVFQ